MTKHEHTFQLTTSSPRLLNSVVTSPLLEDCTISRDTTGDAWHVRFTLTHKTQPNSSSDAQHSGLLSGVGATRPLAISGAGHSLATKLVNTVIENRELTYIVGTVTLNLVSNWIYDLLQSERSEEVDLKINGKTVNVNREAIRLTLEQDTTTNDQLESVNRYRPPELNETPEKRINEFIDWKQD